MGAFRPPPTSSRILGAVTLCAAVAALASTPPLVSAEVYLPRLVSDTGTSIPTPAGSVGVEHPRRHHQSGHHHHQLRGGDGDGVSTHHEASAGGRTGEQLSRRHHQEDGGEGRHHHRHHQHARGEETGRQRVAYTWGIGGARVGRPSDSRPTPPGRIEGTDCWMIFFFLTPLSPLTLSTNTPLLFSLPRRHFFFSFFLFSSVLSSVCFFKFPPLLRGPALSEYPFLRHPRRRRHHRRRGFGTHRGRDCFRRTVHVRTQR